MDDSTKALIISGLIGSAVSGLLIYILSSIHRWNSRRHDLAAAIMAVRFELTTNIAYVRMRLDGSHPGPIVLANDTYRSVQLILNRGLTDKIAQDVSRGYGVMGLVTLALENTKNKRMSSLHVINERKILNSAAEDWQRINEELKDQIPQTLW